MGEGWTLAELVERAGTALTAADVRAPNGRVTEVPDGRMVRWYATTGLLDRPVVRGRVAYYGERHLLQLVAVKRLQAQGLSLAEIQQRLAGAPDSTLRRVAALAAPTASATVPTSDGAPMIKLPAPTRGRGRARFWAAQPVLAGASSGTSVGTSDGDSDSDGLMYGVRLGRAILLLPSPPSPDDLAAIREAARPLQDALAERGLLDPLLLDPRPDPNLQTRPKGGLS